MLAILFNTLSLFLMLRNTKLYTCLWLVAQDVPLVVFINWDRPLIRPYKVDLDRQRRTLEIKHIYTL